MSTNQAVSAFFRFASSSEDPSIPFNFGIGGGGGGVGPLSFSSCLIVDGSFMRRPVETLREWSSNFVDQKGRDHLK